MAKILSENGIDAIDVSSAAYDTFNYWLEPTTYECGWRKNLAEEVKKIVDIPVIAANLIRSPKQAEEQINAGIQDFAALGRPLIADPHWVNKVQSGNEDKISREIKDEIAVLLKNRKGKMDNQEYGQYQDELSFIASAAEESGFVKGFQFAFRLFTEVIRE